MVRYSAESGVSLAFVAIIVAIAGIASATFLVASKKDAHWNPIRETQTKLEKINEALIAFQRENDYIPCPAPINVTSADASYGFEATPCVGAFLEGAVPFRTLELAEDYGVDAWDMKITYIMNPVLSTAPGFAANNGSLTVTTDSAVNSQVAYVLISHGKDLGGYHKNGTTRTTTSLSSGVEQENWDEDDEALQISHNYEQTTDYFDDIVVWAEVDKIAKIP